MIVDGNTVLLSSINWNRNSPNFNREAGVIIKHEGVARYYLDVFEDDWYATVRIQEKQPDYARLVAGVIVLILLVLFWYYRSR